MANTTYGTPYVTSSDYVTNYPTTSLALANAVDTNAFGIVALATKTADQTGIGSAGANISSLSATWTAYSARYYRTTLVIPWNRQQTSASYWTVQLRDGGTTVKQTAIFSRGSGDFAPVVLQLIETGLTGSTTRQGWISTAAGTVDITATGGSVPQIVVEDLGIL